MSELYRKGKYRIIEALGEGNGAGFAPYTDLDGKKIYILTLPFERFEKFKGTLEEVCEEEGYRITKPKENWTGKRIMKLYKPKGRFRKDVFVEVFDKPIINLRVPEEKADEIFAKDGLADQLLRKIGILRD